MARKFIASLSVLLSTCSLSAAKDIRALAGFVAPAYTAMNVALVCARHDPAFLSETGGPRGTALAYAEHVKDEAIASLTHDEATAALRMAADEARATALRRFRAFNAADRETEAARIKAWCETDGRQQVRAFVMHHDSNHQELVSGMRQAQQ